VACFQDPHQGKKLQLDNRLKLGIPFQLLRASDFLGEGGSWVRGGCLGGTTDFVRVTKNCWYWKEDAHRRENGKH